MIDSKICTKCKEDKLLLRIGKSSDKFRPHCKDCISTYNKEKWIELHPNSPKAVAVKEGFKFCNGRCSLIKELLEFTYHGNLSHRKCKECYSIDRMDEYRRKNPLPERKKAKEGFKFCEGECLLEKNLIEEFYCKGENSKGKRRDNICKVCRANVNNEYYYENRADVLVKQKKYSLDNKKTNNKRSSDYYENNREIQSEKNKIYYQKNKQKIILRNRQYRSDRKKADPIYKLRMNISADIAKILRSNGSGKRGGSILKYLPCNILSLKNHIENLFEPWMNWDNQGHYKIKEWDENNSETWKWQLDHIIPHSEFKYTSMEDQSFRDCWELTNLRPLCAKQNLLDGVKRTRHKKAKS